MNKRIVSGLAALAIVFSGATALPTGVFDNFSLTASAETHEDLTYTILDDGTVEISKCKDREIDTVVIPSEIDGKTVTSIGAECFYECKSLESVTIPDSVTNIGDYAFGVCKSLKSITIPESVNYIGNLAFISCTSLESIVIPEGITEIKGDTFRNCPELTSITLPKSLTKIDYLAFSGCSKLKSIVIPDKVTFIGESAFFDCYSLENVRMPNSVKRIDTQAFMNCPNLKTIAIPKSVTSFGAKALGYSVYRGYYSRYFDFTIKGYEGSSADAYAKSNGFKFEAIDAKTYPVVTSEVRGKQFRIKWTSVPDAEEYGLAVYQAGSWRVKKYFAEDVNTYTSPKLAAGTYKMVVCAKVNGEWDTSDLNRRTFTVTIK